MQNESSSAHGIRWGVIIGIVYCLFLFLRFHFGADNAGIFSMLVFAGFVTVVILLFFCGKTFRKKNGGYVEMKEAFKTMFIAILIFELFYAVFTVVYLKYINPQFFDQFRVSMENLLLMAKQPQADIDKAVDAIDAWAVQAKNLSVFDFLKTYLYNVAVTGLFALLFAFILKRKQPFADDHLNLG